MQAIQITDGRTSLWQWDTGVSIKVYGCTDVDQMHFVTPGGIISRDLVDGECGVPDAALQTEGLLKMYAFDRTENGGVTRCDFLLMVKARPKPADYIDPPDEYDNLEELAKRVASLIPGGGGEPVTPEQIQKAVDNYLTENPVQVEETDPTVPGWAKAEQKPTYTAEEVGALPADAEIVDTTARDGVEANEKAVKELSKEIAGQGKAIEELKESGGATPEQIKSAVNSYLEEHPVQSTPVDKTLENANEAADAEITGNLFFGHSYVIENGGSGGKQFAVNLYPGVEYTYTNNGSAGQNLVITFDDDSTKTITGNLHAGTSVTFVPEKHVKSIGGWYTASAAFSLVSPGVFGEVKDLQEHASEADKRVDGLQHIVDDVNNRFTSVLDKAVALSEIGYLTTGGNIYATTSACNTGKVMTVGYSKVRLTAYCPTNIYALGFYDADGVLLTDDSIIGSGTHQTYDVAIPDTAAYVLASNLNSSAFDAPTCRLYNAESFEQRINAEKCNNVFAHSAFAAFAKFGVIGDSLSVGYTGNPITGQDVNRNIPYSWPQFMARMLGNSALNFGFSGLTTKTWMSSAYGKDRLIVAENMCQAYIVGLGVNDAASLSVGTVADVDFDDMSNNADTYFGWYAKIIKLINDTAEHAKVFLLTDPLILPVNKAYNDAVRVLAANEHFNNVYLVDLADEKYKPLFESVYVSGARSAGHYSAVGYSNIASAIAYCLSDVMMQTPDDFISIPFIPYGDADALD